jgi:aminopeptidase N
MRFIISSLKLTSLKVICGTFIVSTVISCASHKSAGLDPVVALSGGVYSAEDKKTDVTHYTIAIEVEPKNKTISGYSDIVFEALQTTKTVEFKLDDRFDIFEVSINGQVAKFEQGKGLIKTIHPQVFQQGQSYSIRINYSGSPHVAVNAPWDGGIMWSKTPSGEPWIATAIQGYGCDVWWPCKDHFLDKPESVDMAITVPKGLVAVMNGKLVDQKDNNQSGKETTTFYWKNHAPVNDYNIALNIGPYVNNRLDYQSVTGQSLSIEFWSLKENQQKAQTLLEQDIVHQVAFLESTLGPYPWQQDKIGFVETPHLGMEHQSVNGYGNGYKLGKHGFDWLLHHELSHEWFGNLITHQRGNDAWIHESFTMYMQPAYARDLLGESYYQHFMYEAFLNMDNCKAVVQEGDLTFGDASHKDIYWKGAWMLHSLRWMIGDNAFWNSLRQFLYGEDVGKKTFKTRYRSTQDWVDVLKQVTGEDYSWMVNGYLKQANLPELVVERSDDKLSISWKGVNDFPMPVPVQINKEIQVLDMSKGLATIAIEKHDKVLIDPEMKVLRKLSIGYDCESFKLPKSRF